MQVDIEFASPFAWMDHDRANDAAQELDRFGALAGLIQEGRELLDLPPICLGQIRVQVDNRRVDELGKLVLERLLLLLKGH